ncbi:MAG: CDP-alcohol phosphatidyltransferase family protein, partial [Actinomycetota bacterium]|nr:CDP-alcohol phosphatidyltransferase family protein [Actinomycetota bacterium]
MTTAVVVATAATEESAPASLLALHGGTVLGHLCGQLRAEGVDDVRVLTRPEWHDPVAGAVAHQTGVSVVDVASLADTFAAVGAAATTASGALLLAHGEIVTHTAMLAGLLRDPRVPSGIASSRRSPAGFRCMRVRIDRGRVVSAESPYHAVARPNGVFLGLAKVGPADRSALAAVAGELAALCREQLPALWEPELAVKVRSWGLWFFRRHANESALAEQLERAAGSAKWLPDPAAIRTDLDRRFRSEVLHPAFVAADDVVSLLVTGLCRSGVVLTSTYLRELFWARPFVQERADAAATRLAEIDEDKVLLDSAVKASDGFFTTFFVSPYSKYLARWCARRGFTPNQVTTASMGFGLLAGAAFALGTRVGLVAGALLLQVAFTTDCVDGQLARYTRRFSKLGAWLDSVFDRGKEYVVYAGLALGASRAGEPVWLLAGAAIGLQTLRHTVDFSFAAAQHRALADAPRAPLTSPAETARAATPPLPVDPVVAADAATGA